MNQETTYETQRIDHLGIVAGICREISLVERIDAQVGGSQRKVSCGQAVTALVLNALGFSGRALYLMPEYLANKPVDVLIDGELTAADFSDDALGRGLDALYTAGVTEVFAGVAAHALRVYGIEHRFVHLDSSSFHLHGVYDIAEPDQAAIEVSHGYSRDHRPELKQAVVQLITSQASALPVWLEVLSGNSSDKNAFPETVRNYCRQLQEEEQVVFVMDSAGYSAENLASLQEVAWLMRVPETIGEAKEWVRTTAPTQMTRLAGETFGYEVTSRYGEVAQRWLLVYSQAAYDRELEGLERRQVRELVEATKAWRKVCQQDFNCAEDAHAARQSFNTRWRYHRVHAAQVNEVRRYARPGRPAAGEQPAVVQYTLQGELVVEERALTEARCSLGKFIIASNVLEPELLSAPEMLSHYKEQGVSVERGFRFLKDPLFFAHSLFLKSPQRIMALLMVMGLALLVYALAERKLRQALTEQGETIPDQKGKPTSTPTLRRVFQIFEGVDLLLVRNQGRVVFRQVLNLLPVHQQILQLLGPNVANCYRSSA
jgi:transposase